MKWVKSLKMILLFCIVCVLFGTSSAVICQICPNDCGDAGYLDCSTCQCAPSCDIITCEAPRECVLEPVECSSMPCPKMPLCLDMTRVCQGSLLRNHDSTILCDMLECPRDYSCKKVTGHKISVCCKDSTNKVENIGPMDGNAIPGLFWPPTRPAFPPSENIDEEPENGGDCGDCPFDPCEVTICQAHPTAQCVTDDCSCSSWYIDQNAKKVDCFGGNAPSIPQVLFPPMQESVAVAKTTTTLRSDDDDVDVKVTVTQEPPRYEGSHNGISSDVLMQVIVASCVVFACIVIVLVTCKIIRHRKKHLTNHHEEEQLKPLQMTNGNCEKPEIA